MAGVFEPGARETGKRIVRVGDVAGVGQGESSDERRGSSTRQQIGEAAGLGGDIGQPLGGIVTEAVGPFACGLGQAQRNSQQIVVAVRHGVIAPRAVSRQPISILRLSPRSYESVPASRRLRC